MPALPVPRDLAMDFPYEASDASAQQIFLDVSRRAGIVARLGDGVSGNVTIEGGGRSLVEVLNETSSQLSATWWFDGAILHVDSDETLSTVFVDPMGLSVRTIERELEALGLYDPRFALRASSNGAILRISGPRGYVDQVIALIETLNQSRRFGAPVRDGDTSAYYLPRIIRGGPSS